MIDQSFGYVMVYRRVLDNPVFKTHAEALAFVWLVMKAAWKPSTVRYKNRVIELDTGQCAVSVRDMAAHLEWSKDRVSRLLNTLQKRDMIATATATGVNIITICKYREYQLSEDEAATVPRQESRQDRDSTATQINTEKESNTRIIETRAGADGQENGSAKPPSGKQERYPCPEGVDPVDWDSLLANRKAKRSPMTPGAYRQIIKKLDGWKRDGWPPGPIVAAAVERGWTTVFATDEMKMGNTGSFFQQGGGYRQQPQSGSYEPGRGISASIRGQG